MFTIPPPAIAEALAREHVRDLHAGLPAVRPSRGPRVSARSVGTAAGWFLVHVGLRLAVSGRSVPTVAP
jgi:hypothetical protein